MKKIPLTQGQYALVDDEDYIFLKQWKWYASYNKCTKSFYAVRSAYLEGGSIPTKISMHSVLIGSLGKFVIDHINHNTLDNRKKNIRTVNKAQNTMNRRVMKSNKSGFTGVCWSDRYSKWVAQIQFNKKKITLGSFILKCQAVKARKDAEEKYFGGYAYNKETDYTNNK